MSENKEQIGWAILELMGHRRLAGHLSEQEIAGSGFLRIDVFPGDATEAAATQYYAPAAVYAITPTTEAVARQVAKVGMPEPVSRWELSPALPAARASKTYDEDDGPEAF